LPHYSKSNATKVTLTDISKRMLQEAKAKSSNYKKLPELQFVRTTLESMPFPNNSFDSIISIDVFCSVKDPIKAMHESARVLKPGGKFILVEHYKSGNKRRDFLLWLVTVLLTSWTLGVSMVRDLHSIIRSEPSLVIEEKGELKGIWKYIICRKTVTSAET
jgi:ubiquinone/menaquinone biosynthesis C-methylase UbiE